MSNSARVGEIFQTTGAAFNKLGELTMQLKGAGGGAGGAKWTDQEIAMLHTAVHNFAADINAISETMKNKTVNQIKGALQKKAFEDAGITLQQGPTSNPATTTTNLLTTQNKLQEREHSISQQGSAANPTMMDTSSVSENTPITPSVIQTSTPTASPGDLLHQPAATTVTNQHSTPISSPSAVVIPVAETETLPSVSAPASTEVIGAQSNANVTLNMLNASENEVDVEGLEPPSNNRLDFGSST